MISGQTRRGPQLLQDLPSRAQGLCSWPGMRAGWRSAARPTHSYHARRAPPLPVSALTAAVIIASCAAWAAGAIARAAAVRAATAACSSTPAGQLLVSPAPAPYHDALSHSRAAMRQLRRSNQRCCAACRPRGACTAPVPSGISCGSQPPAAYSAALRTCFCCCFSAAATTRTARGALVAWVRADTRWALKGFWSCATATMVLLAIQ